VAERQKILIVDDRKDNLVALRQVLSDVDAEIVEATSGNQALAATLDHEFAVAILDVQMPGMSGYELAEHMRGDDKTNVIPIVFLTAAYADEQHVFRGYEAGAVDYLTKPYSPEVLRGKVSVFLQLANYRRVVELHRDHLDALVVEQTGHLTVRVKEIKCLYAVSSLVAKPGVSIEASLKAIVNLIVPGWPYREIVGANVTLDGREFRTDDCRDTPWRLSADIITQGMTLGSVEVSYLEERSALGDGPFGAEERDFIDDLARQIGVVVERKQAEECLWLTEKRLSEAQRLARVGSWELDPVAGTLTWSDELYRLLELDPARSAPSYEARVEAIHPDDRALLEAAYTGALQSNTPYVIDHRLLMRDGRVKHVHERCEGLSRPLGRPPQLAGTVHDITERKIAEETLLAANQELKRLDALTRAFVSTVSHELRTPLAITKEAISLVLDDIAGPINEQQRDVLGAAARNTDRLARIVNDLLNIAKLDAGMMPSNCASVDIVAIARQVASDLQPQAVKKRIELRTTASAERITLDGDADKLVEIFSNLVSNAITATEAGHIEIRIAGSADAVECVVADTGTGISATDLPHAFDRFQQFGRVYGAGPKGTGLGLAIVRGLVELHHGTIRVESRVGEGTSFTFVLPKCSKERILGEERGSPCEVI
jgi:signal transduction histidine kinase/DNA-binding response OmpR family regulator